MLDNTLCLYSMENGWLVQSHTFHNTITHVQWLDNIGFIAHIAGAKDVCIMRLDEMITLLLFAKTWVNSNTQFLANVRTDQ